MKILYYDLLREKKDGTYSNHINEVVDNIIKHGNTVMFRTANAQKKETMAVNFSKRQIAPT